MPNGTAKLKIGVPQTLGPITQQIMKIDLISLYLTAADHDAVRTPVGVSGELTFCCGWIQHNSQIAVHVNPSITDYGPGIVESTVGQGSKTVFFDIHKPLAQRFAFNGTSYEMRLLTWSRHDEDTLRFDFEIERIEA